MKRVIFDTNVYGFLFKEPDLEDLKVQLILSQDLIVYGYFQIRKELRNIAPKSKVAKKLRNSLLVLYDTITHGRIFNQSSEVILLAEAYHEAYKTNGDIHGWHTNIKYDFMLVACASLNRLDVVVSADRKTLRSRHALNAYDEVNAFRRLETPDFLDYSDLVEKLRNH